MKKISKFLPRIVGLVTVISSFTVAVNPAFALMDKLGVLKSPDNEIQWAEITSRLNLTNVDYCVLDANQFESEADLNEVKVLLIANVENMNGAQAQAIERWMLQGGKVIISGPTGNLADREVRTKLRELFGAYWAYPLTVSATLEPQPEFSWISYEGLEGTMKGGVLTTTEETSTSETAAIWLADGNPPAVIFNDSAIVFGWRWGVDAVSSARTDIAWLTAALNYYGQYINTVNNPQPKPCNPAIPNNQLTFPDWQKQNSKSSPKSTVPLQQIQGMNQELEEMIGRFQTTLNMIEAYDTSLDLSTTEVVEKVLSSSQATSIPIQTQTKNLKNKSHEVLAEAKKKHEYFLELVKKQEYQKARQEWFQTRNLLLNNYPTEKPLAQPEVRAMWLDRGTIVQAKSPRDLVKIFDRMAEAGINTVFLETVNASYPIYPSRVAPEQNPLIRGWDPLETAITLAHERGMELHAWVWVFAAANQVHNTIIDRPKDYLGPVLSLHPYWLMENKQGKAFDYSSEQKKAFYDPANREVQNYLLSLLTEITTNYQVDGIHLDYIRYPFQKPEINQSYGYSRESREQFRSLTGVDPITLNYNDPLWIDWNEFRINQINNFVFTASHKIKQKRPEVILSTAVFPIPKEQRLKSIQQHWEYWAENEWVDLIVLMSYGLDNEELAFNTSNILQENQSNSTLIIPGIKINQQDLVTIDRMQLLRNLATDGYSLFAAENFSPGLERILRQTQGNLQQPLPYRQPLETLVERYQGLQREWSFLIAEKQLVMDEKTLKEWSEQVDFLGASLNRLASEPSRKNLLSAQIHLSSFQRKFERWMWEHQSDNLYQVKAWQNRLASLEKLLNYGGRFI
jgi:uncharacterized lipoprotein YddW (UPF0748 family)